MMKQNDKVLAIDPGTRDMGVAFLDGDKLVYHAVKVIRGKRSPHERLQAGRQIVLRLIRDFRPTTLVIEKTFFARNRNTSLLNVFADEIVSIGRRKGLKVKAFAPSTMKKAICGNGRASKEEVAKFVAARFPELKVYLTQDRKWKARFHQNMFDAVALAMVDRSRN